MTVQICLNSALFAPLSPEEEQEAAKQSKDTLRWLAAQVRIHIREIKRLRLLVEGLAAGDDDASGAKDSTRNVCPEEAETAGGDDALDVDATTGDENRNPCEGERQTLSCCRAFSHPRHSGAAPLNGMEDTAVPPECNSCPVETATAGIGDDVLGADAACETSFCFDSDAESQVRNEDIPNCSSKVNSSPEYSNLTNGIRFEVMDEDSLINEALAGDGKFWLSTFESMTPQDALLRKNQWTEAQIQDRPVIGRFRHCLISPIQSCRLSSEKFQRICGRGLRTMDVTPGSGWGCMCLLLEGSRASEYVAPKVQPSTKGKLPANREPGRTSSPPEPTNASVEELSPEEFQQLNGIIGSLNEDRFAMVEEYMRGTSFTHGSQTLSPSDVHRLLWFMQNIMAEDSDAEISSSDGSGNEHEH